jgi:hypothetical protein
MRRLELTVSLFSDSTIAMRHFSPVEPNGCVSHRRADTKLSNVPVNVIVHIFNLRRFRNDQMRADVP